MQFLPDKSDEEIVALARTRNPEYFGDLVLRHQDKIFRFVRSLTFDPSAAEDLTQVTFERAFVALNTFNVEKKFTAWLFTIAKNQSFSYLRSQKNKRTIPLDAPLSADQTELTLGDTIASPGALPDETMDRDQHISQVRAALKKIKPSYRGILSLFYLEELTYEEIAQTLGLRLNTVRTNLRRAKLQLAKILKNETFE